MKAAIIATSAASAVEKVMTQSLIRFRSRSFAGSDVPWFLSCLSIGVSVSYAQTIEFAYKRFLQPHIGRKRAPIPVHKRQKARLEIVAVHDSLIGIGGLAPAVLRPYS